MKSLFKKTEVPLIALTCTVLLTNFLSTIPILILLLLTSTAILRKDGFKIFNSKSFKLLTYFYIIFIIYGMLGLGVLSNGKFKPHLFSFILVYSVFIISSHLRYLEWGQIKTLLYFSIIAFAICVGITAFIATINPMAIRLCFRDVEGAEEIEASVYRSMGIMSYELAHSISILSIGISALVCYAKKWLLRFFSICLLVVIIKLQFDMTITTALLLSIIGSLIVFVNKFANGKILITFIILFLVMVTFFSMGLITDFLSFAEDSNTVIFKKLNDLFESLMSGSGQGQVDYRDELYTTSLNTFLSNPILGMGIDNGSRKIIGEHSFFLDYLAYYGLFALLYFWAWWVQYKSTLLRKDNKYRQICLYSFLPIGMLVLLKASSVCISMPFASLVFLQIVFLYLQNEEHA